ncbi:DNA-3-methyladenine glycosylase family protein [Kribbella sp. NPDC051620]|uniref:DNA-3-methyladenine glycosylase family protein n=1 Tax=Kribbella sp. NPDC051620 TaxID=3364120 RepID=UPI00379CB93F
MTSVVRRWRAGRVVDPHVVIGGLRKGPGDPAYVFEAGRRTVWRATRTPEGAVLIRLTPYSGVGEVEAEAWGAGASWALDGVPELLGEADSWEGFEPLAEHPALVEAARRFADFRVPRTRAVFEAMAAAGIEQVVTGKEAFAGWRMLLREYGEPAPGPGSPDGRKMMVPPSPEEWRMIPSWQWLRAGVEGRRSRVVITAATRAAALERTLELTDGAEVERRLRSLPGVGVWTAAEVRQRAHGDADAFSFADYHVSRDVSYALTGEELDDDGCAELIEPYRGHRYRVQALLSLAGHHHPRYGPRKSLPTHTPGATHRLR